MTPFPPPTIIDEEIHYSIDIFVVTSFTIM